MTMERALGFFTRIWYVLHPKRADERSQSVNGRVGYLSVVYNMVQLFEVVESVSMK
jgi:hypothetical protein